MASFNRGYEMPKDVQPCRDARADPFAPDAPPRPRGLSGGTA